MNGEISELGSALTDPQLDTTDMQTKNTPSIRNIQEDGLVQDLISFSVVTKDEGILTKIISMVDGELIKNSSECQLSLGTIEKITCTPDKFATGLHNLNMNQALVHGVSVHKDATICSKSKFDSVKMTNGNNPVITRTKDNLAYPEGPGLLMFDHDKPRSNAIALDNKALMSFTPTNLINVLRYIFPEIGNAAWVSTPSTSSCIYDDAGNLLRGEGDGFHQYLFPKNAQDIPRFMHVLGQRLILNGFGRVEFSKVGSMLGRTIVDLVVASPERLDFVAGAVCRDGLKQRLPAPHLNSGTLLDTSLLPDLTDDEKTKHDGIVAELKKKAQPTQTSIRKLYIDEEVTKLTDTGIDKKTAIKIVTSRVDGILDYKLLLYLSSGKNITVGDLLAGGKKYDGVSMADPLEPEYGGWDRGKSKFYWNDGRPCIHSFAHGSIKYTFESFNGDYPAETLLKLYVSWFSVNWRIPLFELDYSNGGIYHAKKA